MRTVIQRVSFAEIEIDRQERRRIGRGFVVLCGFEEADTHEDIIWMSSKIAGLRIFSDDEGKMNVDIKEIQGEIMIVSQFTLYASTKKGNRPSFIRSAKPDIAVPLYELFVARMKELLPEKIVTGSFGADMQITLNNDGPVTITIDTHNKE